MIVLTDNGCTDVQLGAASYQPAPGDVEGWAFGAGGQPSVTAP
ncbi:MULTISPECIES: hypothetical protein [unclassified Kitasatospora]